MKKTLLLILLSIIIFSKKINAQTQEPRVIQSFFELYNDAKDEFYVVKENRWEFNEFNDTSSYIYLFYGYNPNPDPPYYYGEFYKYDEQKRLIKKLIRRFNPDVDLWITLRWQEYFYDNNNCMIEKRIIDNSGNIDTIFHEYVVDENCKKTEGIRSVGESKIFYSYTYPDENNSIIINEYFVPNQLYRQKEFLYNSNFDNTKESNLKLFFGADTSSFSLEENEFDYIIDPTTQLINRKTAHYYNNFSTTNSPSSEYKYDITYDYKYDCNGYVKEEIEVVNGFTAGQRRTRYIYEGKNDCFDYSQNLEVNISPNPSSGFVSLTSKIFESGDTQIQVFSWDGKYLGEKNITTRVSKQDLDFSFLQNGIYILKLKSENHFTTTKMIISK